MWQGEGRTGHQFQPEARVKTNVTTANERTFLGYLRTSVALSILGTLIAQLYRLQHRENPSNIFGYFVLSKPLSAIFQCAALCIVLVGGIRFWRQQSAMAIGRVHAGGWEVIAVAVGSFLVSQKPRGDVWATRS